MFHVEQREAYICLWESSLFHVEHSEFLCKVIRSRGQLKPALSELLFHNTRSVPHETVLAPRVIDRTELTITICSTWNHSN